MKTKLVMSAAAVVLMAGLLDTVGAQRKTPPSGKGAPPKPTAEENYAKTCQVCHGVQGKSPLPLMSLADGEWKHGTSVQAIAKVITDGIPGTAMLPNKDKFSKEEIQALARLVRTFDPKLNPKKAPAK